VRDFYGTPLALLAHGTFVLKWTHQGEGIMKYGTLVLLTIIALFSFAPQAKAECQDVGICVSKSCPNDLSCYQTCVNNLNSCLIQQQYQTRATTVDPITSLIQNYFNQGNLLGNGFDYYHYYQYGPNYLAVLQAQQIQQAQLTYWQQYFAQYQAYQQQRYAQEQQVQQLLLQYLQQ
jgi:hypothetical protein